MSEQTDPASHSALHHSVPPFDQPGHWFRGNLHVHSTTSDGELTPEQVIQFYRENGYHFLAFTDHRILSPAHRVADDFVVLSGIEVDGRDPESGLYHLVGLGTAQEPDIPWGEPLSIQAAVDRMRTAQGLVMLAHPYWSGQMSKDLLGLQGCFGLEVYNGGCDVDDAKGFSAVHWDDLLASGRSFYGLAVDDAHWRSGTKDAALGWVWVRAAQLTQEAILDALAKGHFYASSGPEMHDLELDPVRHIVTVRCSPSTAIDFVGNGWRSHRVSAPRGQTLTEATYKLREDQTYVRVACQDEQGHWAWSNPIVGNR
jgi:hypothetical protein